MTNKDELGLGELRDKLGKERDRHVVGYPGPRRDVADLLDQTLDVLTTLIAERDALAKALKPFASKMDWPLSERDAGREIFCKTTGSGSGASFGLSVDDFRLAATALREVRTNG